MEAFLPFLSITLALTLGALSPGPSFVMVARTSLAGSRADGLAAALGMGVGGAYLINLGIRIWSTASPRA